MTLDHAPHSACESDRQGNPTVWNLIAGRVHKILIVDDVHAVADTRLIIFKSAGYDARAALSAEEALQLVADWIPDLAILDVIMPNMNGIELALLLKATHPNCRIVLSSGHPDANELLEAANASGQAFEVVVKPTHPQDLLGLAAQLES